MATPPVHHRDRALRRLSLVTKGVAAGAVIATGGLAAAIANATPAAPTSAGAQQKDTAKPVPATRRPQPASRASRPAPKATGRTATPTATRTSTAPGGRGGSATTAVPTATRRPASTTPPRAKTTAPKPPPAPPTSSAPPPPPTTTPAPEPTPTGGT